MKAARVSSTAAAMATVYLSLSSPAEAVKALEIAPQLEQEAAFCLHLVESIAEGDFNKNTRIIQLLAQSFSYLPDESTFSRTGVAYAQAYLDSRPKPAELLQRLDQCRRDLSGAAAVYNGHSCGFGVGTISKRWSELEYTEHAILLQWLESEGVTLSQGSPYWPSLESF